MPPESITATQFWTSDGAAESRKQYMTRLDRAPPIEDTDRSLDDLPGWDRERDAHAPDADADAGSDTDVVDDSDRLESSGLTPEDVVGTRDVVLRTADGKPVTESEAGEMEALADGPSNGCREVVFSPAPEHEYDAADVHELTQEFIPEVRDELEMSEQTTFTYAVHDDTDTTHAHVFASGPIKPGGQLGSDDADLDWRGEDLAAVRDAANEIARPDETPDADTDPDADADAGVDVDAGADEGVVEAVGTAGAVDAFDVEGDIVGTMPPEDWGTELASRAAPGPDPADTVKGEAETRPGVDEVSTTRGDSAGDSASDGPPVTRVVPSGEAGVVAMSQDTRVVTTPDGENGVVETGGTLDASPAGSVETGQGIATTVDAVTGARQATTDATGAGGDADAGKGDAAVNESVAATITTHVADTDPDSPVLAGGGAPTDTGSDSDVLIRDETSDNAFSADDGDDGAAPLRVGTLLEDAVGSEDAKRAADRPVGTRVQLRNVTITTTDPDDDTGRRWVTLTDSSRVEYAPSSDTPSDAASDRQNRVWFGAAAGKAPHAVPDAEATSADAVDAERVTTGESRTSDADADVVTREADDAAEADVSNDASASTGRVTERAAPVRHAGFEPFDETHDIDVYSSISRDATEAGREITVTLPTPTTERTSPAVDSDGEAAAWVTDVRDELTEALTSTPDALGFEDADDGDFVGATRITTSRDGTGDDTDTDAGDVTLTVRLAGDKDAIGEDASVDTDHFESWVNTSAPLAPGDGTATVTTRASNNGYSDGFELLDETNAPGEIELDRIRDTPSVFTDAGQVTTAGWVTPTPGPGREEDDDDTGASVPDWADGVVTTGDTTIPYRSESEIESEQGRERDAPAPGSDPTTGTGGDDSTPSDAGRLTRIEDASVEQTRDGDVYLDVTGATLTETPVYQQPGDTFNGAGDDADADDASIGDRVTVPATGAGSSGASTPTGVHVGAVRDSEARPQAAARDAAYAGRRDGAPDKYLVGSDGTVVGVAPGTPPRTSNERPSATASDAAQEQEASTQPPSRDVETQSRSRDADSDTSTSTSTSTFEGGTGVTREGSGGRAGAVTAPQLRGAPSDRARDDEASTPASRRTTDWRSSASLDDLPSRPGRGARSTMRPSTIGGDPRDEFDVTESSAVEHRGVLEKAADQYRAPVARAEDPEQTGVFGVYNSPTYESYARTVRTWKALTAGAFGLTKATVDKTTRRLPVRDPAPNMTPGEIELFGERTDAGEMYVHGRGWTDDKTSTVNLDIPDTATYELVPDTEQPAADPTTGSDAYWGTVELQNPDEDTVAPERFRIRASADELDAMGLDRDALDPDARSTKADWEQLSGGTLNDVTIADGAAYPGEANTHAGELVVEPSTNTDATDAHVTDPSEQKRYRRDAIEDATAGKRSEVHGRVLGSYRTAIEYDDWNDDADDPGLPPQNAETTLLIEDETGVAAVNTTGADARLATQLERGEQVAVNGLVRTTAREHTRTGEDEPRWDAEFDASGVELERTHAAGVITPGEEFQGVRAPSDNTVTTRDDSGGEETRTRGHGRGERVSERYVQATQDETAESRVDTRQVYGVDELASDENARAGLLSDDSDVTGNAARDVNSEIDVDVPAGVAYDVTIRDRDAVEWTDAPANAPESASVPDSEYVAEFNVHSTPDDMPDPGSSEDSVTESFTVLFDSESDVFADEQALLDESGDESVQTRVWGEPPGGTTGESGVGALNNVAAHEVRHGDRSIPSLDGGSPGSTIVFEATSATSTETDVRDWNQPDRDSDSPTGETPARVPNRGHDNRRRDSDAESTASPTIETDNATEDRDAPDTGTRAETVQETTRVTYTPSPRDPAPGVHDLTVSDSDSEAETGGASTLGNTAASAASPDTGGSDDAPHDPGDTDGTTAHASGTFRVGQDGVEERAPGRRSGTTLWTPPRDNLTDVTDSDSNSSPDRSTDTDSGTDTTRWGQERKAREEAGVDPDASAFRTTGVLRRATTSSPSGMGRRDSPTPTSTGESRSQSQSHSQSGPIRVTDRDGASTSPDSTEGETSTPTTSSPDRNDESSSRSVGERKESSSGSKSVLSKMFGKRSESQSPSAANDASNNDAGNGEDNGDSDADEEPRREPRRTWG